MAATSCAFVWGFGNAVARAQGGPEEFAGVIYGLTQISSSTSILAEDLNIVKERLPELNDILLKTFGTNTAEGLRNLNISNTEFIDVITNQLSVLDRANGGLNNSFDNLKDNINASLAELGKTINETLKLEVVFDNVSKKIQELVDRFKALTPEQQANIVKFALIAAAIGPVILILGQFATSITSIITLTRTLIPLFTVMTGGVGLLVLAIGSLVAYYASTDEGQKSLSKTGKLLSDSFDRIKTAFQTTLNLLSKLQPLFDILLFIFGKIAVFTFEVVLSQINLVLSSINFVYDGAVKLLETLRLINKQKVEPKVSVDRPSGAGGSWGQEVTTNKNKSVTSLLPKMPSVNQGLPKGNATLDAIKEMQTNKSMMQFEMVNVNTLPTLDLIPKKLEIPSETGKPEIITLTENKVTGNITIESNYGGIGDTPFELNYRPPKSDINIETGKEIKSPGDFSVIENRPRPTREPGDYEFDYDNFDIDSAYSDVERLEKIATGKIKDVKKISQSLMDQKPLTLQLPHL